MEQVSTLSKIIKQINEEEAETKRTLQEQNNNKIEAEIGKIKQNNIMRLKASSH